MSKTDWWDSLSAVQKAQIQKSEQQIKMGKIVSHQAVREKVRKLFREKITKPDKS